jgi:di/tricarboxylate transporter
VYYLPMNAQMIVTITVLAVTAGLFVWGKIRSDIVALCSLLALVLTGILTAEEALSGFSNPIVIMIPGLFIVGASITQTGLAAYFSSGLLKLAGKSTHRLFMLILVVAVLIGSFLSNTATVAMLMPIVISVATQSHANVRRLLMPLAFASSIGGMMTLIGTAPTLVIHNVLVEAGYKGLGFFTILPAGMVLFVIGLFLLWPLSKILDKKGEDGLSENRSNVKSPHQLAAQYRVTDNLYRLEIPRHSGVIDKKLAELDITKRYKVTITEIRTKSHSPLVRNTVTRLPEADTILTCDDVLYIIGEYENIRHFAEENGLEFLDKDINGERQKPKFAGKFRFEEIGMAEVVLLANSRLHNRIVRESGFRENYNVNILAIQRKDQYIIQDIKDAKMQAADMLLIQGTWEDISRLDRLEPDVVVIGHPDIEASKITLDNKAPFAAAILVFMVLSMALNWFPPVIAVLLASVAVILSRCFRTVRDAYRSINWESVILFAAMMPLASAMEKTGTSAAITGGIMNTLGVYGPYAVLAGILAATSFLTMFISNTATAILFAPIALQAAVSMGVSPYPFLIGVTVMASMCLASPFSTPPNTMVMSAGKYNFMDYVKVGLPLQIVYLIAMIIALPLIFPF